MALRPGARSRASLDIVGLLAPLGHNGQNRHFLGGCCRCCGGRCCGGRAAVVVAGNVVAGSKRCARVPLWRAPLRGGRLLRRVLLRRVLLRRVLLRWLLLWWLLLWWLLLWWLLLWWLLLRWLLLRWLLLRWLLLRLVLLLKLLLLLLPQELLLVRDEVRDEYFLHEINSVAEFQLKLLRQLHACLWVILGRAGRCGRRREGLREDLLGGHGLGVRGR